MGYLAHKTVFLAGATGMVGSAIIHDILRYHPQTRIKATYWGTTPYIQDERMSYVKADLRVAADCQQAVAHTDCAILAAATSSGAQGLKTQPWQQVNDNLLMNAVLMESLFQAGIKRVVFIGSATLYQEHAGAIREDQLDLNQDPHPAYLGVGWVMRYLEKLGLFWHQQGMDMRVVRAANIFGPYARFHPATSNFIPALIRKAGMKMDPFEVWGSPDVCRDVIYAADFARAVVLLLEKDELPFTVLNVGSGQLASVNDVVQAVLRSARHQPLEIRYSDNSPVTIKYRLLDCSKAQALLGWQPGYSLEQGIHATSQWWATHKDEWKK